MRLKNNNKCCFTEYEIPDTIDRNANKHSRFCAPIARYCLCVVCMWRFCHNRCNQIKRNYLLKKKQRSKSPLTTQKMRSTTTLSIFLTLSLSWCVSVRPLTHLAPFDVHTEVARQHNSFTFLIRKMAFFDYIFCLVYCMKYSC